MSASPENLPLEDRMLRSIAAASCAPLAWLAPPLWQCRWSTPAYANLHGMDLEALEGQELRRHLLPSMWCQWQRALDQLLYAGPDGKQQLQLDLPYSSERHLPTQLQALHKDGCLVGVLVQPTLDLSLQQALQMVEQSDARMRRFAAVTSEAIVFYDLEARVLDANEAAIRLTGYPLPQLRGLSLLQLAPAGQHAEMLRHLTQQLEVPLSIQLRRRDGHIIDIEATGRRMPDLQGTQGDYGVVVLHDTTARKRTQAQVHFLSQHDALTRLPNRHGLLHSLQQTLARAAQAGHPVTVALVDLDRFKDVNDSLGNAAGDQVLREVGRRLRSKLHPDDLLARIGSDEFAVVLGTRLTATQTDCILAEIQHVLGKPYTLSGTQVSIQASMGTCRFPTYGQTADELLQNAHAALCLAKEGVDGRLQHYSLQLAERPSRLLALEQQLRDAVEQDQLVLHYQPQWNVQTNTLAGLEALVRWQHPQRGLLPPVEFIALAESRGMIALIGRWVMRAACRQIRQWHTMGLRPVPVAVNMSALEFRQTDLVQQVQTILQEEQVDPQWLEIELTETTLMRESNSVLHTLQALKRLGLRLAIDDFGTGYSSLSYLRRYPLDKLKIDRSFLREVPDNASDVSLITSIVQMAKSLQLRTVAEGVETPQQQELLTRLGCDIIQGYHLARPMTADACGLWQQQFSHTDIAQ